LPQVDERSALHLPDALATEAEAPADLGQRFCTPPIETEPHRQDLAFAPREEP
jgi:hypothetical protein